MIRLHRRAYSTQAWPAPSVRGSAGPTYAPDGSERTGLPWAIGLTFKAILHAGESQIRQGTEVDHLWAPTIVASCEHVLQ
ncbi:hypothetical protein ACIBUY_25640 [Streptomyces sp. NPDC050085]|uniref:hypothetical protein n=1 Tax=Streptomyces sp. NPDC050085 TaxID=3365600 RepID=UPI0037B5321D